MHGAPDAAAPGMEQCVLPTVLAAINLLQHQVLEPHTYMMTGLSCSRRRMAPYVLRWRPCIMAHTFEAAAALSCCLRCESVSLQPQAPAASSRAPRRRPCRQPVTAEWVSLALTARYAAAAKSGQLSQLR